MDYKQTCMQKVNTMTYTTPYTLISNGNYLHWSQDIQLPGYQDIYQYQQEKKELQFRFEQRDTMSTWYNWFTFLLKPRPNRLALYGNYGRRGWLHKEPFTNLMLWTLLIGGLLGAICMEYDAYNYWVDDNSMLLPKMNEMVTNSDAVNNPF